MTDLWGNDNGGGGSGPNGHRVFVQYFLQSQNVAGNYSDIIWSYAVDYGDPNYWNNIRNRSIAWTVTTGSSVASVAGSGTGTSDATVINSSDPGYGGQIHTFYTGTVRIYHDSNGHGTIHLAASMRFNGAYDSTIGTDIALPNIVQTPVAPSALTSTRISDSQINLGWTNNNTGDRPYDSVKVYRSTDGAGYALITTLGVVTTYSDTGAAANHKYLYKVEGVNSAGSAMSSASTALWTTPGTPTTLAAAKLGSGDIRLTWTNHVNYSEYTVRIEESQNGGAFAEIASVSTGVVTWDHVAPNSAVTHQYRVRARTTTGTTLNSAYSNSSATIILLATANAPTGLAPSGATQDATEIIVFSWTHNPADATPQSKYQLQYKIDAGAFVTIGPTTSGVSSYSMPAATVTNAHTITWHVATAGQNGTIGAYSSDSVFTTQNRPTSTISVPGATYGNSQLTASWTYFQAQGSAQSSWHAYLWKKGALSDYSDATLIDEGAGSGTTSSFAFTATLLDGQVYGVRVYVTSATGLISVDAGTPRQEFTVSFLPPANATIAVLYDTGYGRSIITIQGTAPIANIQGLVLDGSGDWGSAPDSAALDITGDIDLRADIQPADWTPSTVTGVIEKWGAGTNQRSYALVLMNDGKLRLRFSSDGQSGTIQEITSSVAVGVTDNTRLSIRAARVGTVVTFYTSTDIDLSAAVWTQLGTTQTLSGSFFVGTDVLRLGSNGAGASFLGTFYSAQVRNSAGTVVAYPIYTTQAAGTTSFSDGFSNTWTLVGNAVISTITLGTVAIDTVDLQRQIDGGDWVTWVTGIVLNAGTRDAVILDTSPTVKGNNTYRAIIRSATPSSKFSPVVGIDVAEPLWGFLTTGPGFGTLVRMRALLAKRATVGRNKSRYQFAGRGKPVELSGEETNLALAIGATLFPPSQGGQSSEPEELEDLALTTKVVLWRDSSGRRIFSSLSDVNIDYDVVANKFPVSFTVTQVDYDENVG